MTRSRFFILVIVFVSLSTTSIAASKAKPNQFMVVSYNVENLFDQKDDANNSHYGDYRITRNAQGMSSNYGETVNYEGKKMTFTEVKAHGVVKTLRAIKQSGPEIVALQEVESEASVRRLEKLLQPLGYVTAEYSGWIKGRKKNAIGSAIFSKFPMRSRTLIDVPFGKTKPRSEPLRTIFRVELNVHGHSFFVYNMHWKSKGGPESYRLQTGKVLYADIESLRSLSPQVDYIVTGDLNSNYNEAVTITSQHNDTNGKTGINHALKAQGDETRMLRKSGVLYNLHYELPKENRRTAYHHGYGWSSFDHLIIGDSAYDQRGITYVDNSFRVVLKETFSEAPWLFRKDGTTNRWNSRRGKRFTKHYVGGYSDHLPIFASFYVPTTQTDSRISLVNPGKPDPEDPEI